MAEVSHCFVDSLHGKMIKLHKHVGVRRYSQFLSEVYDLLDDDGTFLLQVAGIRPSWQYEDLIWLALFVVGNRFELLMALQGLVYEQVHLPRCRCIVLSWMGYWQGMLSTSSGLFFISLFVF